MSTRTATKKRKSTDGATTAVKKVKTAISSSNRPPPLKSALKSTKTSATAEAAGRDSTSKRADDAVESLAKNTTRSSNELTSDQTAALLAGFSSEDEGSASEDDAGIDISSLPKPPTTAGAVQKPVKQKKTSTEEDDPETTPGVIYLARIPHGYYEHEMRGHLSQFGDITRLRLMRSRKTGRSQHYAFIEFASSVVAEIVCQTMQGYLMFGHILQAKMVPRDQINENIWRMSSRRAKNVAPRNRLEGSHLRRGATRDVWEARIEREEKKRAEKAEKLKEMGYEFEMPAIKAVGDVPVKPKAIEEAVAGAEVESVPETGAVQTESAPVVPPATTVVAEDTVSKKRPASGKTHTKKAIKKVKA